MVIQPLDSADNKTMRQVKRLAHSQSARSKSRETLIEGPHLIEEALSCGLLPRLVVYSPKWVQHQAGRSFMVRLQSLAIHAFYVTDRLFDELSQVETPQGILAIIPTPKGATLEQVLAPGEVPILLPVAAGIQDPGNLGTLIRAALAAGSPALGVASGTVDPFNPKCIRASAGALFRLPVVELGPDWQKTLYDAGIAIRMTAVDRGSPYFKADWSKPAAIVLGNEGGGLSEDWFEQAEVVTIPMSPASESLNVSIAGAILLFHAAYQRQAQGVGFAPPAVI